MKYSVIWVDEALTNLAALWLKADEKGQIERASNEIDQQLAADPLTCGESRTADTRIFCHDALLVVFRVIAEDRRVIVQDVRDNRRL